MRVLRACLKDTNLETGNSMETTEKPHLSAPLVLGVTGLLLPCLLTVHRVSIVSRTPRIVPQGWAALPFLLLLALGLGVLIGLMRANRARMQAVLRPNRGRVIGALVLGFVTPFAVFDWLPWIVGGLSLSFAFAALAGAQIGASLLVVSFWLIASAVWYPASCLIVSGIRSRWLRVALFALMFWAAYSAVLLVAGTQHHSL